MSVSPLPRPVRRVLLVEDDPAWAALTQEAFRDAAPDVTVEVATDGRAALERLAEGAADLVLLDLHLPDDGSYTVLGAARDAGGPPVLAVSASYSSREREAVESLGGIALRSKPTNYRALVTFIADLVAVVRAS